MRPIHLTTTAGVLVLGVLLVGGCIATRPAPVTVEGPEATDLVAKLNGYIVAIESGGIVGFALPSLHPFVVRPPGGGGVRFLSGPDRRGRIAYIERHFDVQGGWADVPKS